MTEDKITPAKLKARPILFSTPMTLSIMAGNKTETRRIIKPVPHEKCTQIKPPGTLKFHHKGEADGWRPSKCWHFQEVQLSDRSFLSQSYKCPYGQPGDLLWVRETHVRTIEGEVLFRASEDDEDGWAKDWKWKPSIHMPKEYARIWLQVEDIKIERLHDITEEGAMAEGVERLPYFNSGQHIFRNYMAPLKDNYGYVFARGSFESLWRSINGPESWQANPWVWVVKFKVLSTTGYEDWTERPENKEVEP